MRWLLVSAAAICVTSVLPAQNLLTNPGLETGDFTGWTVGGNTPMSGVDVDGTLIGNDGTFGDNFVNVRSGSYAAYGWVRGSCCTAPEYMTMSQTVSVLSGTTYNVGYWLGNDSHSARGMGEDDSRAQIFVNGVGLRSGFTTVTTGSSSLDFINIGSTWSSGAATTALIEYRFVASGTAYVGLSVDDLYFEGPGGGHGVVPEPATVGLVALGLVGIGGFARRRRR